jgi:hypothetical protein
MINEGWAVFCLVGFWGWVASTVGLALTSFPVRGEFALRSALLWGSAVLTFFALWVVSMLHA